MMRGFSDGVLSPKMGHGVSHLGELAELEEFFGFLMVVPQPALFERVELF